MAENTEGPQAGQKVALVTGAGVGGIGGALALELHSAGYFVICAVRRPSSASELLRPGMIAIELDVSSTESVSAAAKKVSSVTNDKLHVLVNNAGSATHRPALDLDVDGVVASMFDVNVLGVMRMVKAFADLLINAKGCVVNIGSIAPIVPLVYSSAYNATKAALHAYGDALRMELKPLGYCAFRCHLFFFFFFLPFLLFFPQTTSLTGCESRVDVVTVVTGGVKSNLGESIRPFNLASRGSN